MAQHFYGSICITEILEAAKQQHPAIKKGNNGKLYVNISVWVNDTTDQYGNHVSMQLSIPKDRTDLGKVYIGNLKKSEQQGAAQISNADANAMQAIVDDLPF